MEINHDVIDDAICGADIKVGRLRDYYEILLCEYFTLRKKEERSEKEHARFSELENERARIERYIEDIKKEFADMCDCLSKK